MECRPFKRSDKKYETERETKDCASLYKSRSTETSNSETNSTTDNSDAERKEPLNCTSLGNKDVMAKIESCDPSQVNIVHVAVEEHDAQFL